MSRHIRIAPENLQRKITCISFCTFTYRSFNTYRHFWSHIRKVSKAITEYYLRGQRVSPFLTASNWNARRFIKSTPFRWCLRLVLILCTFIHISMSETGLLYRVTNRLELLYDVFLSPSNQQIKFINLTTNDPKIPSGAGHLQRPNPVTFRMWDKGFPD